MFSSAARFRTTLLTLVAGVAPALVIAPSAVATPYAVDYCKGWDDDSPRNAFPSLFVNHAVVAVNCVAGPTGAITMSLVNGTTLLAGTEDEMAVDIPADRPNITISRVQTQFAVPAHSGAGTIVLANQKGDVIGNAATPIAQAVDVPAPAGTRRFRWIVQCTAGVDCQFGSNAIFTMFKARLFLDEGVAPTLAVTGGSALSGGPRAGSQTVTFDAADTDSGVRSASVALGSTVVGTVDVPCLFADWSACPLTPPGQTVTIDTSKVPDGSYPLTVTAFDAAGNPQARTAGTVVVANSIPALNGQGASRLARITANFTSTTKRSRTLGFTTQAAVKGRLADENGHPIAAARIAVSARRRQTGAAPTAITTVSTQADGTFTFALPSGPSRVVTFAYTAFGTDPTPATSATLSTTVRASLTARGARRSVRAGRPFSISGRLLYLPRAGLRISIQARDGRRWRTVDEVGTTRTGTYRWPYRFKASGAGRTFAFRTRIDSGDYPFAAATSRVVTVRVRR